VVAWLVSGKPGPLPRRPSVTGSDPAVRGEPAKGRGGADDALRRLAESDLIAVVTATADGAITDANSAFLELTGYSRAELAAGRIDWQAMTPPEWEPSDQAALAELFKTGSCAPFRKEYWRKDGSRVPVEISAVLQSPEPLRWACFIRDVSAEQQAQAAAERGAVLASLAAALSHAATTTEVAEALGVQLRRSTGANLATIIEVDPARPVLRFMDLRDMPEEVARQWAEFDTSLDSPAVRAWRGRAPAFYRSPPVLDEEFPHLAAVRAAAGVGSCLATPLITGRQVTGVLAIAWPEPHRLSAAEESFLAAVAGYAGQALERARLFDAERAARHQALTAARQVQALQEVTAALATAVTSDQVARVLTGKGIGLLAAYGVAAIADWEGGYLRTWTTGNFPADITRDYVRIPLSRMDDIPVGRTARTGQKIKLGSRAEIAAQFPRAFFTHEATGTSSLLTVPVRAGDRTIGALSFGFAAEGLPGQGVEATAETLADLAGQALERARLYEAEYEVSHRLQRSLLPVLPARLGPVAIGTAYRPAEIGREVGGDWYDVFKLPGGRIGCVIGDVVGHDLTAAVAMSRLQLLLRHAAASGAGPAAALQALDTADPAITGTDMATVAYAEYDPDAQTLTYACAGHLPPLLLTSQTGATYLTGGRSPAIGLGGPAAQETLGVPAGTRLVLYTDGLIERRNQSLDDAMDHLAATAAALPAADAQAWCDTLLAALTGDDTLTDDIAVACIDLNGPVSATACRP